MQLPDDRDNIDDCPVWDNLKSNTFLLIISPPVCNFLVHEKCLKTICNPCVGVAATLVQHPVVIIIIVIVTIHIIMLSILLSYHLPLSLSSSHPRTAPGHCHHHYCHTVILSYGDYHHYHAIISSYGDTRWPTAGQRRRTSRGSFATFAGSKSYIFTILILILTLNLNLTFSHYQF